MTSPNPTVASRAQQLAPLLASLLIVVAVSPYFEVLAAQWPLRIGDVGGRFQLIGLIYASAPQTTLALALIAILGLVGGHRTMVRGVAIAGIVLAIFYLVASPIFA
ncbi:MAG TPA: hypothetical protein VHW65_00160, partial [Gemmatimonadales bacterium]|nr:hypothetical protein [Gemmatimonadales bacterium]